MGMGPSKRKAAASKAAAKAAGKKPASPKDERVMLPSNIDVSLYDVTISTNLGGNFRFDGRVKIHVEVKEDGLSTVTLHAKELHVEACSFKGEGGKGKPIGISRIAHDLKASTVTLSFKGLLPKGQGVLDIAYIGTHNDQMAGFYRSGYTDREGKRATMVSTQFEALDARRCVPCFDEPARKAVFKPTLIVDDGLTALGNMPVESDTLLECGKRRKIEFGATPKMSSYLLAFCVGDFDMVEKKSSHGVDIRVYTPPGKKELGEFALDVAVEALDLYDDLFQVPYPLPKLDMVAVPEFAMGAMENWGLVVYREVDLLINRATASSQQKQRVATVVAHELAHQWFGNLVTMRWWDGLWLNEGFASWMQNHCVDNIFPEWQMWEQFIINGQAVAMRLDAMKSSHPVQVPIRHAEEVEEVFDAISYHKGSCVVRLIHSYLGEKFFKEGLQVYMDRHKYSNTETVDLWQAWEEASGKPVKKIMSTWTQQMGFPVVTVSSAEWSADNTECTLSLEQRWFIADGSEHPESASKLWSIPLLVSMGGNDGELVDLGIMDSRKAKVVVPNPSGKKTWIKLNGQQHIPMRVNYEPISEQVAPLFADAILSQEMAVTDRAGLLLDYYALTKAGAMDPGSVVSLLSAYRNETAFPVFSAMEDILRAFHTVLQNNEELGAAFTAFGARLIEKASEEVGWDAKESDGHLTRMMRASLIRLQSIFLHDSEDVRDKAIERFERFAEDPIGNASALPSDIKTAAIKIVLASTEDDGYYNKCLEIIDMEETTQAKKEVYLAMGAAKSLALKERTLDWCTSGAIKKQDFFYPIGSISGSSRDGLDLTWRYLRENFDRIVSMIRTASPSLLAATVSLSCGSFASEEKAREIEEFFEEHKNEHPVPLIKRKLDQIIENTRANAKFLAAVEASPAFQANLDVKNML